MYICYMCPSYWLVSKDVVFPSDQQEQLLLHDKEEVLS